MSEPQQHISEICSDASYADEALGLGFAGFGVWFGPLDPLNVSSPLEGSLQTNNLAGIMAANTALRAMLAA